MNMAYKKAKFTTSVTHILYEISIRAWKLRPRFVYLNIMLYTEYKNMTA